MTLATIATAVALAFLPAAERPTWNPPARYDHPYHGTLHVERLPQREVPAACEKLLAPIGVEAHSNQRGCSVWHGRDCHVITIDRPYHGTTPAAVLRHEIGHCNGWPSDHPR